MSDQLQADIDRVYGEYGAAREEWEKNPTDTFVRRRWQNEQTALRETRELWREIGVACGDRSELVKVDNDNPNPPVLVPDQWTGRRHTPGTAEGE